MNPLKYKKRQQTSILEPVEVFTSSKFDKLNFIHGNAHKKPSEPMKLQRSYREPRILVKKERYESIETSIDRKPQIRSLSFRKSHQQTEKSLQKSILLKRPIRNKQKTINASIEVSKSQINPHLQRLKRTSQNKKLSILDQEPTPSYKASIDSSEASKRQMTLMNRYNEYESKKSESKSKFRVKSTFTKLDSIDMVNSASQESSSLTLTHKHRPALANNKGGYEKQLQKIKNLMKAENFREAILIIRRCFSESGSMDNLQLLQIFARAMYNLEEHYEVIKILQKIFLLNEAVSSEIYIMACLSYAKLKTYSKSLQIIEKGTVQYPENAQIFYYKGKILFRMRNYALAEVAFSKSYSICALPETLLCLADCYGKVNKKFDETKVLDKLLDMSKTDNTLKFEIYLLRKLKLLFSLAKYDQILTQLNNSSQIIALLTNIQSKAQIQYIEALSHYMKGQNQAAYQKFQDCIVSQSFSLESLKMLTVIEIKEKNFYQASHLCSQAVKKGISIDDQVFNLLMNFVEGSISLVRRNFKQGIEYLAKVELGLDGKEFKKYSQKNQWTSFQDLENFEIHKTTRQLVHLFLAYGLFCTGQYRYCQSAITRQKNILKDPQYTKGLEYNFLLCEAILSFQEKNYSESLEHLQEADSIFVDRLEVLFYKAVVLIQVYYRSTELDQADHKIIQSENEAMASEIMVCFNKALKKVSSTANNTHATILYYKTLFCACMKDWKQALTSIDEAIVKSDDTYWRYYYTKGMILACVHSFQEAITEVTAAINFSEGNRAECFLLRSRCLQIQARGNQAFYDLQQYIDQDVHMYAGQLLFENGAFEDALTAFQHKEIPQLPQNYDIYLTLAKTLFLTGKFNEAHQKMMQSYKLNPQDNEILFDSKVIKFLGKLLHAINANSLPQMYQTLISQLQDCFSSNKDQKFGKIFKQMDLYLMQGLIAIYMNENTRAIENFKKHLNEKRKMIIFEDEADSAFPVNKSQEDLQKTTHELKIYTNQMKFNIVVCYLLGGEINTAKELLKDIKIDEFESFYQNFNKFRNSVMSQTFSIEKQEILPNKNKLSQFLPPLTFNIGPKKTQIKLKLCIPFPKVQPPQIFPTFDRRLLKTLSFFGIQGKPEAPWIVKQDNVIKFTQKISYASRLDFNDSEPSNSTTVIIDLDDSRAEQKNRLKTKSNQRSSLFSKRTLKKKNSIAM